MTHTDENTALEREPGYPDLKTLVEHASDGIFVVDIDGRFAFVNEAGCRILDLRRDEIIGKPAFDLIPEEDSQRLMALKARLLRGGNYVAKWRLRRRNRTRLTVEVSAKLLPDGQWQWFVRDISPRATLEARRTEKQRLLQSAFDTLPVGVWITDRTGRIVSTNLASARLFKGARPDPTPEAGQGRPPNTHRPMAAAEWALARTLAQGETISGEPVRVRCLDGSLRTIASTAAPLLGDDDTITGAIVVHEDITKFCEAQERLRAAVLDRERMLAVVAHDLRTPLAGLMMYATTAEHRARNIPGGEKIREIARLLLEVSRGMSGLVDDLLAVSVARIGGKSMLKPALVNASELVTKAAAAARPLLESQGLSLELGIAEEDARVVADEERILRVLANLLENARKFTHAPGVIRLAVEPAADGARFSVSNSGAAISDADLGGLFTPFWQSKPTDRRGAGLGLSICREIVEAHGGRIWAEPLVGDRVRICFILPGRAPDQPARLAAEAWRKGSADLPGRRTEPKA